VLPESVQAHWWLGSTYERLNRTVEARTAFEQAASGAAAGHAVIYAAIGRLASRGGDIAGAVEAFTRAVAARPDDAMLRKALTGALLQQDRAGDALIELQAALRIDAGDAAVHAAIGQLHLNAGRHDNAVASLWRAVELSPGHTGARYALATALLRLGRTQEADAQFSRVADEQRQELAARRRTMIRDVQDAFTAMGR
jgi:Flp pilus assembly protein TadD